jgi:tetratricopeptide (TPR) repeat protein
VLGFFNIYMMRYTFVADHLAYLPALVLIPFAAAALARTPRWLPVSLVTVLALLTLSRVVLFRSEERLWRDGIAHGHDTWLARVNLGLLAKRRGDDAAAITEFETALAMKDTADARVDLANMLAARGDLESAILHYQRALELAPDDLGARHSFASALTRAGHFEAALLQYQRILARDPTDQLATRNRAALLKLLNP